jgi:hypothetical protein
VTQPPPYGWSERDNSILKTDRERERGWERGHFTWEHRSSAHDSGSSRSVTHNRAGHHSEYICGPLTTGTNSPVSVVFSFSSLHIAELIYCTLFFIKDFYLSFIVSDDVGVYRKVPLVFLRLYICVLVNYFRVILKYIICKWITLYKESLN